MHNSRMWFTELTRSNDFYHQQHIVGSLIFNDKAVRNKTANYNHIFQRNINKATLFLC